MKKLISTLVVTLLFAVGAAAQQADCNIPVAISGYIRKASGTPIPRGHVVIFNRVAAKVVTADLSGFYQIQGCAGQAFITGVYDNFRFTNEKYTFTPVFYFTDPLEGPFVRTMDVVANQ